MSASPIDNLDPALNQTLDGYQVINALYDGLTDIDTSDPANAKIVPLLAESYEANDDATVWTFTIKDGLAFADGEPILPSTFQRSWERASSPELVAIGTYQYLFNFIDGGAEKLAGEADTISGIAVDDEAMTLTVTLDAPYSNFDAVAGFQMFFPMPAAAAENPVDYEDTLMVGNGPYTLEAPRTTEEIVLVRNDAWAGDFNGELWPDRPDRIYFRASGDVDTAYNALEAGEADVSQIPGGRIADANENWGTTSDVAVLGAYYFMFDDTDVGGEENRLLRQAISQAIDRNAINDSLFDGARLIATGVTPPGIPGFKENICEFCAYDPEAAQAAFDQWVADGNTQAEPLTIQFNAGSVHGQVTQIIIDNLAAIGIEAEPEELDAATYFDQLADAACVFCRAGWVADYPTYDNFMYDNFHSDARGGGNNFGYSSEAFDALVDEAKRTTDAAVRDGLFQQAEDVLLNDDIGVVPLLWNTGTYAYNPGVVHGFDQNSLGLVLYEHITLTRG